MCIEGSIISCVINNPANPDYGQACVEGDHPDCECICIPASTAHTHGDTPYTPTYPSPSHTGTYPTESG